MGVFKGKNAKWLTMLVALSVVVVLTFVSYQKKQTKDALKKEEKVQISKIDNIIIKDLEKTYPASVREVIKYYYKVLQCMYNGEASDKQIIKLIDKERELFDKELLKENEYSDFVTGRKKEIKQYTAKKMKLHKFVVEKNEDVRYWKNNKKEMASIKAHIFITGNKEYSDIYQEYMLRKDESGKWKILSWKAVSDKTNKEKEDKKKDK